MKKIDKTKILSTEYKSWLDTINSENKKHSESSKYFIDVKMNLLHCQKGVCAYTEMRLCNPSILTEENWLNGRYNNKKVKIIGDLDHFDPKLKKEKHWNWNNLFMTFHEVNNIKGQKNITNFIEFKPDNLNYSPENIFDYDIITHKFIPKISLNSVWTEIDNNLYIK